VNAITSPVETFNETVSGFQKFREDPNSILKSVQFTQPELKTVGTISLYIPETVNFTYAAQYDKLSLATAAQQTPIIGKAAKAVLGAVNSGPAKLLLRGQGYAFNPQQQILFEGIDFRTYQLAFTFTPYSRQEARTVREIIKQFRLYAAPQIKEGAAGMFFIPPATFELDFRFNNSTNENISQVGESVITSIDVNYAPNGFSAHPDGAPVQTTLTLQFKELQLVDRTKISNGF
jgi:hypothetical protein